MKPVCFFGVLYNKQTDIKTCPKVRKNIQSETRIPLKCTSMRIIEEAFCEH